MMKFVIIEDNEKYRKKINDIIVSAMMKNNVQFEIEMHDDFDKRLLSSLNKTTKDTVYILDLELPSGDGLEIARILRNKYNNWASPIIIITAHTSLYYESYKQRTQVLDFIGKCENVEKNLTEDIEICLNIMNQEQEYVFTYKNVTHTIAYSEINYIQREGRRTKISTKSRDYYRNISISDIKEELPPYFVISSKGTIINTKNIDKIDWNENLVYFKDGKKGFLISRSHKKEVLAYQTD